MFLTLVQEYKKHQIRYIYGNGFTVLPQSNWNVRQGGRTVVIFIMVMTLLTIVISRQMIQQDAVYIIKALENCFRIWIITFVYVKPFRECTVGTLNGIKWRCGIKSQNFKRRPALHGAVARVQSCVTIVFNRFSVALKKFTRQWQFTLTTM